MHFRSSREVEFQADTARAVASTRGPLPTLVSGERLAKAAVGNGFTCWEGLPPPRDRISLEISQQSQTLSRPSLFCLPQPASACSRTAHRGARGEIVA